VVRVLTLRPFAEAELGYFDIALDPDEDPFGSFGFRGAGVAGIRPRWSENRLITDARATLAIALSAEVIGDVQWHTVNYGPPPMSDAFNIGIRLRTEFRGKGHGTTAQDALARYLFDTYPINRIEASTDVINIAEQRSLVKAGFSREGVIRGAQWRQGRWNDLVGYSRLRTD
jgi:RimJ/RimL family protein N-acetyltransferase